MSVPVTRPAERPVAYTVERAARMLRMSRQTLYRRVGDGSVRAAPIGPTVRIPAAEIGRLLDGDGEAA